MPRSAAWLIRLVAVAAGAAAIYWFAVLPARCNRMILIVRARAEVLAHLSSVRAAEIAEQTGKRFLDACRSCSTNVNVYLALADVDDAAGLTDTTIHDLDLAIAEQPRPEVYADRGMMKLSVGRFDAAVDDLAQAARFDPVFIATGDPSLRARIFAKAGVPDPSH